MVINISSSQYRLSKGTLTLIEMTPSLLDEIESAISDPLRPVANWAKMLLDQDLLAQQVEVRDDAAEGLQITGTGKFLLLLSELTLLRIRDNSSIFVSVLSPIVVQVTEKDLQAGTRSVSICRHRNCFGLGHSKRMESLPLIRSSVIKISAKCRPPSTP